MVGRSGSGWGCGLLFAPSKDRDGSSRDGSWEPHGVWTDSKSAHTDTHRHVSLSSPHAGFISHLRGAQHQGEPGDAGRGGSGQPSSHPSPEHGPVPTSPCLTPEPQAEGAALPWPRPSTHCQPHTCRFSVQEGPREQPRQSPMQPLGSKPSVPFIEPSSSHGACTGLSGKDRGEEEELKSMIIITNLLQSMLSAHRLLDVGI